VRALATQGQAWLYAAQDADAAEECFAQALSARPDDALALVLQAELRALQGLGAAALELAERALASLPLEPMRYLFDGVSALAAVVAGDSRTALACARRAVERNPHYLPAMRTLVVAQVLEGMTEEARRTAARLAARLPAWGAGAGTQPLPAFSSVAALFAEALQQASRPAR
jgi:tetratricopeptide (TPR) repeat protein